MRNAQGRSNESIARVWLALAAIGCCGVAGCKNPAAAEGLEGTWILTGCGDWCGPLSSLRVEGNKMQLTLQVPPSYYWDRDGQKVYLHGDRSWHRTVDITISESRLDIATEDGRDLEGNRGRPHSFVRTARGGGIGGGLAGSWRSVASPKYAATLNAGQWLAQADDCVITGTMSSEAISGGGPCGWTVLATRCEGAGCPAAPKRLGAACTGPEVWNPECSSGSCVGGKCSVRCYLDHRACPAGYGCNVANQVCVKGAPPLSDGGLDATEDRSGFVPTDATASTDGSAKNDPIRLDGSIIQPSEGCLDKAAEPNNSAATAFRLLNTGRIIDWEICYPGDVDNYGMELSAGQRLTVRVLFKHADGDIDAALMAPDGKVVATGRGTTDNETLTLPMATTSGWYVLAVWGFNGATNRYDLDLAVE